MKCKICESNTKKINDVEVMKCYKTNLFHCVNCDYLFLENPHWLEVAKNKNYLTPELLTVI